MNPAIINLIIGKTEDEAMEELDRFKCNWRILMRDGVTLPDLSPDRNDKRYNLVIKNGFVERVIAG